MSDEMGLVARLRHGVPLTMVSGVGEVADTEAADATMDEAADALAAKDAAIERLVAERDEAREALLAVDTWAKAYPLEVFPEPDFNEVKRLLGSTLLSQVSASNMRHVLIGIHGLVSKALGDT